LLIDLLGGGTLVGEHWPVPFVLVVLGGALGLVAWVRLKEREDLRGRRAAKVHVIVIVIKAVLVVLTPVFPVLLILLMYLSGADFTMGRPLMRSGRAVRIRPRRRREHRGLRWSLRQRAIARHWLWAASCEHASVTAFEELREQLVRLDAPASLLERLRRAANDEASHTEICLALARRAGAGAWRPGAAPEPVVAEVRMEELAVRQLLEGCMGEGYAAEVLAAGAKVAEPEVARRLRALAERRKGCRRVPKSVGCIAVFGGVCDGG
jgi:hypothetical protein